jgi:two-component system OmpR family response regulator/two-component system response regulator MprA
MAESLTLLLIEDDPDCASLMRDVLERAGHQVTVCGSAESALVILSRSNFDLITLDQWLPDTKGLDLLRMLNRNRRVMPIVMAAPLYDEHLPVQALGAGALDFIAIDPGLTFLAELPERVSTALRRFRSC